MHRVSQSSIRIIMNSSIRSLGSDTIVYAIGTFLLRAVSIVLIPIYTSALAVQEYGAVETLMVLVQTLRILLTFGLSSAILRFYPECKNENEEMTMVRTSLVITLGLSLMSLMLIIPFSSHLGGILFKNEGYRQYIVLAFLLAVGNSIQLLLLSYYRARQASGIYVIFSIIYFLILVTTNIVLVSFLGLGILGILLGNLIVIISGDVLLAFRFWRNGVSISFDWAKKLSVFSFPLIFSMISWLILNSADRFFLSYYKDLNEVGLYALGYKVGLIVNLGVIVPFQLAWAPYVFNNFDADKKEILIKSYSRIFTYLILCYSILGLSVLFFSKEIIFFLGSGKYSQSVQVVPYVIIAYVFVGVFYWAGVFFYLVKKTILLSVIVSSMALLNLIFNWVMIPVWGGIGAAITTVVTMSGTGLLTLIIGRRFLSIPLEGVRLIKLVLGLLFVSLLYSFLPSNILSNFVIRIILVPIFLIFLVIVKFFTQTEYKYFVTFLLSMPKILSLKKKHAN